MALRRPARPGNFNPHLRVGGDEISIGDGEKSMYFNPHLRVGGDLCEADYVKAVKISIHTSA